MARVHLCTDVGGVDLGRQPLHRCRVVDDVVRVHLDADLDVGIAGPSLDVLPVRDGHLVPLVVARVQRGALPWQDGPRRQHPTGATGRQPGHRDHPLDAEQRAELDRIANVLAVFLAHLRVGVKRVAVAVQCRERDPRGRESSEVGVPRVLTGPDLLDRQVRRREETAGVDLGTVKSEILQRGQRLPDGQVMQAGGVRTELHGRSILSDDCRPAAVRKPM